MTNKESTEMKKWMWVPCEKELYKPAYVVEENKTMIKTRSETNQLEEFKITEVFKMNPSKFDLVDDLAFLSHLNEPSVLNNLKKRYEENQIYTYSGLFLIALNPYKKLGLYSDEIKRDISMKKYKESAPHIFSVANEAYRELLASNKNQSILITGESGAGKTENTKRVIEYFSFAKNSDIYDKIVSTTPILEAFGNAKTIKNDNSSRFGKFIELKFKGGTLCGARIEKYLLEKSRIAKQNEGEKSYHIFYYLLNCGDKKLLERLGLVYKDYKCLMNNSNEDCSKEFRELKECFKKLGIEDEEEYYKRLAAILHLSNIEIYEVEDINNINNQTININNSDNQTINQTISNNINTGSLKGNLYIKDLKPVEWACNLLNIPINQFLKEILHPSLKAGKEIVNHSRSKQDSLKIIEGLMKVIYESLFDSLIYKINTVLDSSLSDSFIGVLDIAGFEIFHKNSFEQLCINYTNEKLQQFFNHQMFILEQEIYKAEGISWDFIDFGLDLEPTIRLIESNNPIGILSYLDEECVMPQASDFTLLDKIRSIKGIEHSPLGNNFKIKHYAGIVEYEVVNWLEKNKDYHSDVLHTLCNGNINKSSGEIKKGFFRTVSQSHRENLKRLMEILRNTNPHFVRCILPNLKKSKEEFDKKLILEQLRCNGVLEGIRISRLGYPTRMSFKDFNSRYLILRNNNCNNSNINNSNTNNSNTNNSINTNLSNTNLSNTNNLSNVNNNTNNNTTNNNIKSNINTNTNNIDINNNLIIDDPVTQLSIAKNILENNINSSDYKIGFSMVFLKQGILADLENLRDLKIFIYAKAIKNIILHKISIKKKNLEKEQRNKSIILQKNMKNSYDLLKSKWWQLFIKIKPLLEVKKNENLIKDKESQILEYIDLLEKERKERKVLENNNSVINNEFIIKNKENELLKSALEERENKIEELIKLKENEMEEYKKRELFLKEKIKQCELKEENHSKKIINEENLKLLKEVAILNNKNEEQSKAYNNLTLQIKKIQNELDDSLIENEKLIGELRKKEDSNKLISNTIMQNKKEIEYLKSKNNNLEESLIKSNEMVEKLVKESEEFRSIKNSNLENLNKQVKAMTIKLNSLETINKELQKEKEELAEENLRLSKEKIEELCIQENKENQERKVLQLELNKLRLENEKLKNDLSSFSTDESFDALLNQQLENERIVRKQYEKKVNELEMNNVLLENKVREIMQELKENELEKNEIMNRYMQEYISKEDLVKIKEKVEKIRKEVNYISGDFYKNFLQILCKKEEEFENLVKNLSEKNKELLILKSNIKNKNEENNLLLLRKEVEELVKKNSLLKTNIDDLTVVNCGLSIENEELKGHLKKVEELFGEREKEIDLIIKERKRLEKRNENRNITKELEKVVLEYLEKIEELSKELERVKLKSKGQELEIEELKRDYEESYFRTCNVNNNESNNDINNNESNNNKDINNNNVSNSNFFSEDFMVKQKIVSSLIVDKDSLKNLERKKLLSCNCGFLNKIKIVEIQKDNKEELIKLMNENDLLNLRLKQNERIIEEQKMLIEQQFFIKK